MNVGSLFSGIGGFDLGLERAGMRTVWFCEQDPYCQRVLARHWPGVPIFDDVRSLVADANGGVLGSQRDRKETERERPAQLRGDLGRRLDSHGGRSDAPIGNMAQDAVVPVSLPSVDVLCGGFPCQDLSYAGKGAGIEGSRSGLWSEYARLIGELRPRYVIVENVPALLARGFGRVLGDLAALGFDAEWDCLPASAFGAPHRRDRVWIVAYPNGTGSQGRRLPRREYSEVSRPRHGGALADADGERWERSRPARDGWIGPENSGGRNRSASHVSDADNQSQSAGPVNAGPRGGLPQPQSGYEWWAVEPSVGRVAHGIPNRVDRLRALGNALVPQIAEWIGRRIVAYECERVAARVAYERRLEDDPQLGEAHRIINDHFAVEALTRRDVA